MRFRAEGTGELLDALGGIKGGLQGLGDSSEAAATSTDTLSTSTDKAAASVASLNTETEKTKTVVLAAVGSIERVNQQLDLMDAAASGSPIRLQRAIVAAKLALDDLKNSANATGNGAAIQEMQDRIDAMMPRLSTVKLLQQETAVGAQQLGLGWRQAATAGGSFRTMMIDMALTSTGLSAEMAKVGLYAVGAFEAFKVGHTEGEKLRQVLVDLGIPLPNLTNFFVELATGVHDVEGAFDHLAIPTKSLGGDFGNHTRALEKLDKQYKDSLKGIVDFQTESANLSRELASLLAHIDLAAKEGKLEEWTKRNANAIRNDLVTAIVDGVITIAKLPAEAIRAVGGIDILTMAVTKAAAQHNQLKRDADEVGKSLETLRQNYLKEAQTAQDSTAAIIVANDKKLKALRDSAVSAEEYSIERKKLEDETTAAVIAGAAKQKDADGKLAEGLVDLKQKTGLTGAQLETLGDVYVANQKKAKDLAEQDASLAKLKQDLRVEFNKTIEAMGPYQSKWEELGKALQPVGEKLKVVKGEAVYIQPVFKDLNTTIKETDIVMLGVADSTEKVKLKMTSLMEGIPGNVAAVGTLIKAFVQLKSAMDEAAGSGNTNSGADASAAAQPGA